MQITAKLQKIKKITFWFFQFFQLKRDSITAHGSIKYNNILVMRFGDAQFCVYESNGKNNEEGMNEN